MSPNTIPSRRLGPDRGARSSIPASPAVPSRLCALASTHSSTRPANRCARCDRPASAPAPGSRSRVRLRPAWRTHEPPRDRRGGDDRGDERGDPARRRRRAWPVRPARSCGHIRAALHPRRGHHPRRRAASLRGRDRATWGAIVAYGLSLAALNLTYFEAIQRIPLGIAVTFAFVAPLGIALAGSRRRRDVAFALLAAAGVVTLGGVDRAASVTGIALAVAAGGAWACVAFAGRSVGRRTRRIDGLALAVPIAAARHAPVRRRPPAGGRRARPRPRARDRSRRPDHPVRPRAGGAPPPRAPPRRRHLQRRSRHRLTRRPGRALPGSQSAQVVGIAAVMVASAGATATAGTGAKIAASLTFPLVPGLGTAPGAAPSARAGTSPAWVGPTPS